MRGKATLALVVLAAGAMLATAVPATAAPAGVTLAASATTLSYGEATELSGAVDPPAPGEMVSIVNDATGSVLATAATDATGAFRLTLAPDRNLRLRALAHDAASDPVDVLVRPVVSVGLGDVLLFGEATVSGSVRPPLDGVVSISLLRGDGVAVRREAVVAAGSFRARVPVEQPGRHRVVVEVSGPEHLAATAATSSREPPLPRLRVGSRGVQVRLLEGRLRALGYHVPAPDRRFDGRTADAVLAFHKVQGRARSSAVGSSTWRALASPRRPVPRSQTPRVHVEVDQTKQVLYVVRGGKVASILHVSTGGPGVGTTRDGVWRVWLKFPGYSPKGLYMPAFFDGGRAIHGWPDVPPTPASHGCVRVPMWTARWMYRQVAVGSVIRIYHS